MEINAPNKTGIAIQQIGKPRKFEKREVKILENKGKF